MSASLSDLCAAAALMFPAPKAPGSMTGFV